jgi:hypothetical protein
LALSKEKKRVKIGKMEKDAGKVFHVSVFLGFKICFFLGCLTIESF